jgi:hypothetical protein
VIGSRLSAITFTALPCNKEWIVIESRNAQLLLLALTMKEFDHGTLSKTHFLGNDGLDSLVEHAMGIFRTYKIVRPSTTMRGSWEQIGLGVVKRKKI